MKGESALLVRAAASTGSTTRGEAILSTSDTTPETNLAFAREYVDRVFNARTNPSSPSST
jgi:hypothetical protein